MRAVACLLIASACGRDAPQLAPGVGRLAILADEPGVVGDLVVHDGFVWWTANDRRDLQAGKLARVPIAGGAVEHVVRFRGKSGPIAAGDRIYFGAGNTVMALDGIAPTALTPPQLLDIADLAVRDSEVLFTYHGRALHRAIDGQTRPANVFEVDGRLLEIAVDDGALYVATDNVATYRGSVIRVDDAAQLIEEDAHSPMGLARSAAGVFWVQDKKLRGLRRDGSRLRPQPIDAYRLLAASGSHLYWTEHERLVRRPIAGGALETVGPEARRVVISRGAAYGLFVGPRQQWHVARIDGVE